ncbi:hypothetical protein E0W68_11430 [Flavobacterium salilacus subsp. salilacus]|uniref:hypothetical protein n=1 Tax=Flavobacterium TaxID=237 RepID=UPI00107578AF|nr:MULTISPECIES: hypothetical protein [Flavobacterium]KAF2516819.1 hypothetical protein E0W68_11430 [Flavobacterium salilacus subsp. salilacus]MBE1615822.1 hypothetical protein [Flavobacterium sp. SaA2.13]
MEPLDKLKNDWKKNGGNYPKFSEQEIYAMLHKRSSSIVKWILVISMLEFVFWLVLSFVLRDSSQMQKVSNLHVSYITLPLEIANYVIILFFVTIFYRNYKKIKVTDNARKLMQNILRTKKAVTHYIFAIITYNFIGMMVVFILFFMYDPELIKMVHEFEEKGNVGWFYLLYIGLALIATAIILLVYWFFYRLIYGLLLKRLKRNYDELKKLDF